MNGSLPALALQAAVRIPTVSSTDTRLAPADELAALRDVLAQHFPLLWREAGFELISDSGGLLGCVQGAGERPPIVLMGHQDVVPAPPDGWTHPPFEGTIDDGFVWGRGTLDCKGIVVAICAALERVLAESSRPPGDVWCSFGANEEVSGDAAQAGVDALVARGVEPWLVLDEGGAIVTGALPGLRAPVAVIGVAEKGTTDLELVARTRAKASHSSTPPRLGATARLARAIWRLERRRSPAMLHDASVAMFEAVAPRARPGFRQLYGSARALRWPLARVLALLGGETEAIVRTTVAVTRLQGSAGQNVLAHEARAGVNVRVAVGETAESAIERVRGVVGDPQVAVRVLRAGEPTRVAPLDSDAMRTLAAVTTEVFPDAVTAPYIMLGASDARFFHARWPEVYRFSPIRMTLGQRDSVHGIDERIAITDLEDAVEWYRALAMQGAS